MIDRLAELVVRRELAPLAIFCLEAGKPFSRVGSQALIFFMPLARTVLRSPGDYERLIELLDDREELERLICRIEALEDERLSRRRIASGSPQEPFQT